MSTSRARASESQHWAGCAEVIAKDKDLLEGSVGAFVQVICKASSSAQFLSAGKRALLKSGFEVLDWMDVQVFDSNNFTQTLSQTQLSEICFMIESRNRAHAVWFGDFHAYEVDEEDN